MGTTNLVLFYGNNLSTQMLTSQLSLRLTELGHKVYFIHSKRSGKAAFEVESQWPEVYYPVMLLEQEIFPFLDAQPMLEQAKAWSPSHLVERFGTESLQVGSSEVNREEPLSFLKEHAIQGGISVRFPFLLKARIMDHFNGREGWVGPGVKADPYRGFLWNLHSGMLPEYAGYAPFRWVMFNEEPTATFTLQELGTGFDTGAPIAMHPKSIDYSLDMFSALLELIPTAVDMTVKCVNRFCNGKEVAPLEIDPKRKAKYYPRLTPEDRARMVAKGMRFVDLKRLKVTLLENFSVPGSVHYSRFSHFLDGLLGKE